jgi:multiple sugar transport system substrate-binding protein
MNAQPKIVTRRDFLGQVALYGLTVGAGAALGSDAQAAQKAPSRGPFEGVSLTWEDPDWYKPSLMVFIKAFSAGWAAANKAEVTVTRSSLEELLQKGAILAETGIGPDIYGQRTHVPSLYPKAFADVGDICGELEKRDGPWSPAAIAWCKVDGVWRGVPMVHFPGAWNYRQDLMEQAGWKEFPKTMDELLEFAKVMHKFGKPIGLAMGHAASDGNRAMYAMFWAMGGREVDKTGTKIELDSPGTADALEYMKKLFPYMHEGVLSWLDPSNNQAFFAGTCSATINVDTIYLAARDQKLPWVKNMRHAPQPKGPGGQPVYQEGIAVGINARSKNIAAAKALLRAFFDSKNFGAWLKDGEAYITSPLSRYSMAEYLPADPIIKEIPTYQADSRMPGWPGPFGPKPAEAMNKFIIVNMMAKAAQGENTRDIIKWGVDEYKQIYAKN